MALGLGMTAVSETLEPTTGFSEIKDNAGYAATATYTTTSSFSAGKGYVIAVSSSAGQNYTGITISGATQLTSTTDRVAAGSYYVNAYSALFYIKPSTTGKLTITVKTASSTDKSLFMVACPLG